MTTVLMTDTTTPMNKIKIKRNSNPTSTSAIAKYKKTYMDFILQHYAKESQPLTNTRIPGSGKGGGSFHIPEEEYSHFLKLYANAVIIGGLDEHLTEKQLDTNESPILIDLDFRFPIEVDKRQYDIGHIRDIIIEYTKQLKTIFQFDEESTFPIYVFEKPHVNRVHEKNVTKDGIHIIIGIQMAHKNQLILRKMVMAGLHDCFTNFEFKDNESWEKTWEKILDEGISAGNTNWQLYGSKKPDHEKYELTHVYNMTYDPADGEFKDEEESISVQWMIDNIEKLSARYKNHPSFFYSDSFVNRALSSSSSASASSHSNSNNHNTYTSTFIYPTIRNKEELDNAITNFLNSITDYTLREMYEYTMILPDTYYGSGSYMNWLRVGWALRNTSDLLYVVWVAFSAKSKDFKYTDVPDLLNRWLTFGINNPKGLTKASLIYWAKTDAPKSEYEAIRTTTIDYYAEIPLNNKDSDKRSGSDNDIAHVLYQLFKHEYKCIDIKANTWQRFVNHRWVRVDSGITLCNSISTVLRNIYHKKSMKIFAEMTEMGMGGEEESEEQKKMRKSKTIKQVKINDMIKRLGTTNDKKNIMTEAKGFFYDPDFYKKLDENTKLLCCENGVVDFELKQFRKGYPEDYLSKSTLINYIPLTREHQPIIDEIHDFMNKLFPVEELRNYMWDHLASTLIGDCPDQTFNMYIGVGRNGKSALIALMEQVLGLYKGDVPITLITEKRTKVGGVCPEIVALKGIRYAVMQEPSKNDRINEGMMKQLTGGDSVQGRAPYMVDIITFIPQFKLVVCANYDLNFDSFDEGTWRRIRRVDFEAVFVEKPVHGDKEKPYQYKLDKDLKNKFNTWKEVFLSMLVQRIFQNNEPQFKVKDCNKVLKSSEKYKLRQDFIAEFIEEKVIEVSEESNTSPIRKTDISATFTEWYISMYGHKLKPNITDVYLEFEKRFGKPGKNKAWNNIRFIKHNETNTDNEDEEEKEEDEDDVLQDHIENF